MRFYGTSAAEAIPNPFCSCYLCENARKMGGKDVRHRSMFRIDEETCDDMGGDALIEVAFDTVGTKKLMLKTAGVHITKL